MPFGSRFGRLGQWWADRSRLEQILIIVILIATVVIVTLSFKAHQSSATENVEKTCQTPVCLREASRILEHLNPDVDPCEDFYQFTCGSSLNESNADDTIELMELAKELLLTAYKEPIRSDEHKMVKAAKKLFQACMDQAQTETVVLKTMKEALKAAGGWPVLEGPHWNEVNFNWQQATYQLRKLGYYYVVFLDLWARTDPEDDSKSILLVSSPYSGDLLYGLFKLDKVELMKDVAEIFGVKDVEEVSAELVKTLKFAQELERNHHPFFILQEDESSYKKFTIDDYQQRCRSIRWLEFINNIVGPAVQLSNDDLVLFPAPANLTSWFDLISRTSKRTQANYLMWRVIEETIPYLTSSLRHTKGGLRKRENHEDFCLGTVEDRYIPSPVNTMVNRKYVSKEKRKRLEELILNIKIELVRKLDETEWMDEEDKQKVLEKVEALDVVIVQDGDYFDDKVLDDLDVDMIETKRNDFLSLLAQATRNRESAVFSQLRQPNLKSSRKFKDILRYRLPLYLKEQNALLISTVATGSIFFDEKRPDYLNYGAMGFLIGYQLVDILNMFVNARENETDGWSNKTRDAFEEKARCLEKELAEFNLDEDHLKAMLLMHQTIGNIISYSAYERWSKANGEELKLISTKYTAKQLFWISTGTTFCKPNILSGLNQNLFGDPRVAWMYLQNLFVNRKLVSKLISESLRNNANFANDFGCPVKSTMTPLEKCQLF